MASVTSQLIEEVTAHAQNDSLVDARVICADGSYFPNNLRTQNFGPHTAGGCFNTLTQMSTMDMGWVHRASSHATFFFR